ncbi:MAG: transporter periplasmic subunit [Herbinix sp.]|jgi:putative aldouronate transport system substrate-binding protein|nr:transporter periplasmic subunit [Herbinix sp.]
MKKIISILIVCCLMFGTLTACSSNKGSDNSPTPQPSTDGTTVEATATTAPEEIVDGKFTETRQITVEVYDRGNDGGSKPEDNFYTNYIKEGMLRDHNVEVTFVPVPRWTEVEQINNLLASGTAPDVCVTYDYSTIQTYAGMGGVTDLSTYVVDNKELLPNLWSWLGETNINWDKNPTYGTIWALEAKLAVLNRVNTFVREDWLKKLNIAEPTSIEEFEAMLKAFKDNASTLLGADADKMVPFSISFDVGWRADHLLSAFVPNDITDKDYYVNGFDDRKLLLPGVKDGVKTLNKWYNDGLIWKDFALYGAGDTTEDSMMKAGYVGAFIHNWDYPYRNGEDSIQSNLARLVGPDAGFIAIEPFKNDAGVYRKFLSGPVDRKVFFPTTNDEPVASLMYLDWISQPENRQFLQIGEEGVTHETQADGAIKTIASTGDTIMNSPNNIDYTITCNGLDLGDPDLTVRSIAQGYAGIDSRFIEKAFAISPKDGRIGQNVKVGAIKAEEGMGPALSAKRDTIYDQAVVAPADQFDSVFDSGLNDYLSTGGQAIIDERKAAWEKTFGDVTALPAE